MRTSSTNEVNEFKALRHLLTYALWMGLVFAAPGFAEQHSFIIDLNSKQVTEISNLGGGETYANDINDSGQVVGWSKTIQGEARAFITGPNGLGINRVGEVAGYLNVSDSAVGINNAGQVVGNYPFTCDPEGFLCWDHSFITGPNGQGTKDLGFNASGINDAGIVVGRYGTPTTPVGEPYLYAVVTQPNGTGQPNYFGRLLGPNDDASQFIGINNAGLTVGASNSDHAVISDVSGEHTIDLSVLAGNNPSIAVAINDVGQAVGWYLDERINHAFITSANGTELTDLGTLGGHGSQANEINNQGQVVGWSDTTERVHHAFVTGPDGVGMVDLNSMIKLPDGIVLTTATGINNRGQIIAVATIPEPESYALFLAGLSLIGFVMRRKIHAYSAINLAHSAWLGGPENVSSENPDKEENNLIRVKVNARSQA